MSPRIVHLSAQDTTSFVARTRSISSAQMSTGIPVATARSEGKPIATLAAATGVKDSASTRALWVVSASTCVPKPEKSSAYEWL